MQRNNYVKLANLQKIGCLINIVFDDVIKKSKILFYNLKQNLLNVYITLKTKSLYVYNRNITLNYFYQKNFFNKTCYYFSNFLLYFINNLLFSYVEYFTDMFDSLFSHFIGNVRNLGERNSP